MSFLTLEDVNGTLFKNQKAYWHNIDTSKISTEDFENIKYDFVTVTRETDSVNNYIDYTFQIDSDNWTKGAYVTDANGNWMDNQGVVLKTDNKIIFRTSIDKPSICLFLYMGNFSYSSYMASVLKNEEIVMNYKKFETHLTSIETIELSTGESVWQLLSFQNVGYSQVGEYNDYAGYVFIKLLKSDFGFSCNQELTVGKVNKVQLGTDSEYKPNGDMIGANTPSIHVEYNGNILPVTWNSTLNDYVFDLDLTDKTNIGNIRFKVLIESNQVINASETTVILQSQYQTVSSFSDLKSACNTGGIEIIKVGGNITFTESIPVKHSIKIVGNDKTFDLNGHSMILDEGIQFNTEKISFTNGDTAIIQKNNSKVALTNCSFTNCTSSEYNQLGSCIFCDTDISNLDDPNDFETKLINCTFIDNQCCIFHSGQLTVDNCKLHNTDKDYVNINNVAFVYQADGYANIINSTFDIDYDIDDFCTAETNLGFAQALVMCGETANINGATYLDLGDNDTLPLFTQTRSNQAHLFAKYYYPKAETCVYASPLQNKENQCCCHAVSGVDWIFKNNTQITRVSWDTQNENRLIQWEE